MRRERSGEETNDRQRFLTSLGAAIALALVLRVTYLQTVRSVHFRKLANAIRSQSRVVSPRRGELIDRNGLYLARTRDAIRVEFDPVTFSTSWRSDRLEGAKTRACGLLSGLLGMSVEETHLRMFGPHRQGEPRRRRLIKDNLTVEESRAVQYVLDNRPNRAADDAHALQGVTLASRSERYYGGGDSSAAIMGRVTEGPLGTLRGIGGIEDWADVALGGSVGWYLQRVDAARRPNLLMPGRRVPEVPGLDAHLTVDLNIQRICAAELDMCMKEHTPAGATAIVLDPKTGDVLGMVSRPSVDLGSPNAVQVVQASPGLLRNRALFLYEPGSVMKPLTIAIGLQNGVLQPNQSVDCGGSFTPGKRPFKCEAHKSWLPAPGTNTPRMIIAKSCNVAAGKVALRLGADRLDEGLRRFGVLDPSGIQLRGDAAGWSPTGSALLRPGRDDIARIGFGQSLTVTPLALAAAFGAFANGGVVMRPRIIRSFSQSHGGVVQEFKVQEAGRAVSAGVANEMREYLQEVVRIGTGKNAAIRGYTTAGKTGTAQKVKDGAYREYIASFIGFVPASSPRAVVAVVVDEPKNGYHGSQAAAPAWGRIAARLMQYWHVAPDKAGEAPAPRSEGSAVGD